MHWELLLELLIDEIGTEGVAQLTSEVGFGLAGVIAEGVGLLDGKTYRPWIKAVTWRALETFYRKDAHSIRSMDGDELRAAAEAIRDANPHAVDEAVRSAMSDPGITALLIALAPRIKATASQRDRSLSHDVAYADIPEEQSIMAWAAELAKHHKTIVEHVLELRAAARGRTRP